MRTHRQHGEKKREITEKCFDCYAESGLSGTGIKTLAKACGFAQADLYVFLTVLTS